MNVGLAELDGGHGDDAQGRQLIQLAQGKGEVGVDPGEQQVGTSENQRIDPALNPGEVVAI